MQDYRDVLFACREKLQSQLKGCKATTVLSRWVMMKYKDQTHLPTSNHALPTFSPGFFYLGLGSDMQGIIAAVELHL